MELDITDRIEQILKVYELSPSAFSDLIQVQRSAMSHIFSRRNRPSLDVIQKILKQFPELNSQWLLTGTGKMKQLNLFDEGEGEKKDIKKNESKKEDTSHPFSKEVKPINSSKIISSENPKIYERERQKFLNNEEENFTENNIQLHDKLEGTEIEKSNFSSEDFEKRNINFQQKSWSPEDFSRLEKKEEPDSAPLPPPSPFPKDNKPTEPQRNKNFTPPEGFYEKTTSPNPGFNTPTHNYSEPNPIRPGNPISYPTNVHYPPPPGFYQSPFWEDRMEELKAEHKKNINKETQLPNGGSMQNKEVDKIVIFYKDKTFSVYQPE